MIDEKLVELIVAAQKDDSAAIETLFAEIYNDVYYFAKKTVKDEALAEDITQEALIDIFKNIKTLTDPVAFPAWSRQITYHRCTAHFRKKQDVLVEENEDGSSIFDTLKEDKTDFIPDAALDQKDFSKTILEFIDTLSEEQRSAVLMYYFDEMSISDIAAVQGVSEGTVKSRLNYARKGIKVQVEEYENKSGIKLHSIALLPLMRWIFTPDKAISIPSPAAVQSAATAVSTATSTAATATAATGSASAAVAAGGTATVSVITKVIVGLTAAAIIGGCTAAVVSNNNDSSDDNGSYSQDIEDGKVTEDKGNIIAATDREGEHNLYVYELKDCYGKLNSESFDAGQLEGNITLDLREGKLEWSSMTSGIRDSLCNCFDKTQHKSVGEVKNDGYSFECNCGKTEWTAQRVRTHSYVVKDGKRQNQKNETLDSATVSDKEPYAYVINSMRSAYGTLNGVPFSKKELQNTRIELGMYSDGSAVVVTVSPVDLDFCDCFPSDTISDVEQERPIVGTLYKKGTEFKCKCGKTCWTNQSAIFMSVQDIYE